MLSTTKLQPKITLPHIAIIAPSAIVMGYLLGEGVITQMGVFAMIGLWITHPVSLFRLPEMLGIRLQSNVKLLALILGAAWITIYAPPGFAQGADAVASCDSGTGMFARIAQFFAGAFTAAGQQGAAADTCLIMRILEGLVAILFIGSLVYAVNEVRGGAEVKNAFMPLGLVLVVVVASGLITRLVMGA